MNARPDPHEFRNPEREKLGKVLRCILHFLAEVMSSPQGDMGGWEGGARGL